MAYVDGELKLQDKLDEVTKLLVERRSQIENFRANYQDAKVRTAFHHREEQ
jgi:hypothetical protein